MSVGGNNAVCIRARCFLFLPRPAALAWQAAKDLGQRLLQPVGLGVQPSDLLFQRRHLPAATGREQRAGLRARALSAAARAGLAHRGAAGTAYANAAVTVD